MKIFISKSSLKNYVTKEVIKLTDTYLSIKTYFIFDYPFYIIKKKKLIKYEEGAIQF